MAATRKPRVPLQKQIRLINECRKSGMTDADWCRENDITPTSVSYVKSEKLISFANSFLSKSMSPTLIFIASPTRTPQQNSNLSKLI